MTISYAFMRLRSTTPLVVGQEEYYMIGLFVKPAS